MRGAIIATAVGQQLKYTQNPMMTLNQSLVSVREATVKGYWFIVASHTKKALLVSILGRKMMTRSLRSKLWIRLLQWQQLSWYQSEVGFIFVQKDQTY